MNIFEAIKSRRAIHHFEAGREISDGQLKELFEYVALTPSGYNIQPWQFVVIRDQERKSELAEIAFGQMHVAEASAVIIVLGDTNFAARADEVAKQWEKFGYLDETKAQSLKVSVSKVREEKQLREMVIRNVGLVTMTLLLAAEGMGLGTCPMMGFSKWKLRSFLNLPDHLLPGMMIAIGYKDKDSCKLKRLPRRNFDDLVKFETWSD